MLDLVAEYWSEGLSVAAILVAIYTRYYQVQHYKAESADLGVLSIDDATYAAQGYDSGGGFQTVDPAEYDDHMDTKYSFTAVVENDGRETTTLSDLTLILPDTGEEIDLYNERTTVGWKQSHVKFTSNDRQNLSLFGKGDSRDKFGDDVDAVLRLGSTAGTVEASFTLEFVEPTPQDNERPDSVFGE